MKGCWSVLILFKEPRFYYHCVFWLFFPTVTCWCGWGVKFLAITSVRQLEHSFLSQRPCLVVGPRAPVPCKSPSWKTGLGFLTCFLVRLSSTSSPSHGWSRDPGQPRRALSCPKQDSYNNTVPCLPPYYEWKSAWVSSGFERIWRFRFCHGSEAHFLCNLGQVI